MKYNFLKNQKIGQIEQCLLMYFFPNFLNKIYMRKCQVQAF